MTLTRKDIFLKAWLWSLIVSIIFVAIFWIAVGFISFFHGSNGLTRLTDAVLLVSLVGDVLGASLIAWRVADKYYHAHARESMKRYLKFSLLSIIIAVVIFFTPFSLLIGAWSLATAYCVLLALPEKK